MDIELYGITFILNITAVAGTYKMKIWITDEAFTKEISLETVCCSDRVFEHVERYSGMKLGVLQKSAVSKYVRYIQNGELLRERVSDIETTPIQCVGYSWS